MPVRYRQSDLFLIPVAEGEFSLGRVVLKMRGGNVLVAIYSELAESVEAVDLGRLSISRPVFLVETMDLRLKDGTWRVAGNWTPPTELSIPVCKTQVEPGGDFFAQHIDGSIGRRLTPDEAARLKKQKSFSPMLVEKAAQAFQGVESWLPVFDEIRIGERA
ncbi:immunity 26/phosphotriesterase HocA family protein [Streptacidiphilus sp. ASG 303]|uniref:immunity 26/phosphotriesterase HocA family protein n=1 Tax=Streptacidiphilus sp. ASG 303 TaxID=2896847 RepID=UPI001E48CDFE|nr:immunity 26/phosphotriesterase HocA family protein [Streptacidiphilus sp. ASG 303]MCD0481442.1 immunity 26/phosphotriesterase HocA family protein [Streptacidiphilus sp. ASG 303]